MCDSAGGYDYHMARMTGNGLTKFRMYGSIGMTGRNAGVPRWYAQRGKVMVVSGEIPSALTGCRSPEGLFEETLAGLKKQPK